MEYDWKDLPSVKRKVASISEKLLAPANVFLRFPNNYWKQINEVIAVSDQIKGACEKDGFRVVEIHINGEDELHQYPILYLLDYLEIPREIQSSLQLALKEEVWPDMLFIIGLETLQEEVKNRWLRFLNEWIELQKISGERTKSKVFLVIMNGLLQSSYLPKEAPGVKFVYFHQVLSQVDMKFLTESNHEGEMSSDYYWSSYVLAELALDDPFLLSLLLDYRDSGVEEIEQILRGYGHQLGWDQHVNSIRELQAIFQKADYHKFKSGTFSEFLPYWAEGFISYSVERGIEIHSAALAMINDRERLNRRIWRTQLSLFYNTLDIVRYKISRYLSNTYGHDWPHRVPPRYEFDCVMTDKGPISEYGHLKLVIESLYYEMGSKELAELSEYVEVFWNARNKLAHYKPLDRSEFENMICYLEKI